MHPLPSLPNPPLFLFLPIPHPFGRLRRMLHHLECLTFVLTLGLLLSFYIAWLLFSQHLLQTKMDSQSGLLH